MNSWESEIERLLKTYENINESKKGTLDWAVHTRQRLDDIVQPTIPFVGKKYNQQAKKILVYASAENLSEYWSGNDKYWKGDWLDNNKLAENRHRYCFDNEEMQEKRKLPYVHCGPLEDGGLLVAVMYIASKLRNEDVETPREFYETIAFGNYGKYSIETEFQKAIRKSHDLPDEKKKELKKELNRKNIDYAALSEYLKFSYDYVRADIETLKPDYIIMPNVNDNGFIESIKGNATIIRINQINATVINNMAPNKKNKYESKYKKIEAEKLQFEIKKAYELIKGINLSNYLYVFDYLDKKINEVLK